MLLVKILYFIELEHRRLICHQWQARMHILIYLSFLFFKNPKRHTMYRIVNVQSWWPEGSVVQKWGENGNTDDNPQDATPNGCNLLSPTSLVCFEFLFWPKYQNIDVGRLELWACFISDWPKNQSYWRPKGFPFWIITYNYVIMSLFAIIFALKINFWECKPIWMGQECKFVVFTHL